MTRFCATVIVIIEILTSKNLSFSIMRQSISNFSNQTNMNETKEVKYTMNNAVKLNSYFGSKLQKFTKDK